jgi:hypothetical protein
MAESELGLYNDDTNILFITLALAGRGIEYE